MKQRPKIGNLVQFNSICYYAENEFKIGLIVAIEEKSYEKYKILVEEKLWWSFPEEFDVI